MSDQSEFYGKTRTSFCHHCYQESSQEQVHEGLMDTTYAAWENHHTVRKRGCYYLAKCRRCGNPSLYSLGFGELYGGEFPLATVRWPTWGLLHKSAPDKVQAIFTRALRIEKDSPGAAISQIRRALELVLDDIGGCSKGNLASRIQQLDRQGVVAAPVIELADLLRQIGNRATHHRFEDISPHYATLASRIFRVVVDYVYRIPSEVEDAREALSRLKEADDKEASVVDSESNA